MGISPISYIDPNGAYSKFGAWWRNGFSSENLVEVNGDWGYTTAEMTGNGSFGLDGNYTMMNIWKFRRC